MRLKNLDRYRIGGTSDRPQLAIPPPLTPSGRVYRFSPNEKAHPRHFVLGGTVEEFQPTAEAQARMQLMPRSPRTVCPYSGLIAADGEFLHPDDREAAIETVKQAVVQDTAAYLHDMFKGVARKSKGVIAYKPSRSAPPPKPRFVRDDLMRELVCDHCGRDYGVYAIALFCPDCGAPNVHLHFQRETELIDAQITLAEGLGDSTRELAYRLIGNAHEDVLTAFEATQKTIYLYGISHRPSGSASMRPVGNDFQNVDRAKIRFAELSLDPFAGLDADAEAALRLNVQKRHIIGHNLGVIDDKFAQHAQDARVGETVKLIADDIRIFAGLCMAVVANLDAWLAGGKPAPSLAASPPLSVPPVKPKLAVSAPGPLDHLRISDLAKHLGLWLAQHSTDGRTGFADPATLSGAFPETPKPKMEEALAELEADGFVKLHHVLGPSLPRIQTTLELFASFDLAATGHDPVRDSGKLAQMALEGEASVSAKALLEQTEWPLRRFNPALALVADQIPDGRVMKSGSTEFAVMGFHVLAADRVTLKRYLERVGGSN